MPTLPRLVRAGGRDAGGVNRYPLDQLLGEVAFVAFHFHWQEREIMELEHADRRQWVQEISALNRRINEGIAEV
jgi:hypothetical protein